MQKLAKQNGTAKKTNATVKKEVQMKLAEQATGEGVTAKKSVPIVKFNINLDDRIQKFEKLKGLAIKRERLTNFE